MPTPRTLLTTFLLTLTLLTTTLFSSPTLTIDASHPAGPVSPLMYGLMTEEINHSYDGGLYAELIRNRVFLDDPQTPLYWSPITPTGSSATIALDPAQPLNPQLPTTLCLTVNQASPTTPAGVSNPGFWGIPLYPAARYTASFYAKSAPGSSASITVSLQSSDGQTTYASAVINGISPTWTQYRVYLQTPANLTPTSLARFAITTDRPAKLWLDLVSLFPPTWKNQPNGFRKDLMQMLVDLHPKFLRFPGGAYLEGATLDGRYQWKKTIGPLANRPGHQSLWGYRTTDGLGLLEFLQWCQDMNAQPVLAVFAGFVSSPHGDHIPAGASLQPYVQDALDEIQYVTGDTTTPWGARRAADGHREPFPLHYVEIGNEDFFDNSHSYDARFTQFYDAIKSQYPNLKIISTAPREVWPGFEVTSRTPDAVDEHYYRPADEFINLSAKYYEDYPRIRRPEIFVGEWASFEDAKIPPWNPAAHKMPPTADFHCALGDAAWMAAMERNADMVVMNCYAPLFVNVNPGAWQWRPDFIGFDAHHAFGSPSYYAFKLFSTNLGNQRLALTSTDTPIQSSATQDDSTGQIYLKLINPTAASQFLEIHVAGVYYLNPVTPVESMTAAPTDTNSITNPTHIIPVNSFARLTPNFTWQMPPDTITVLILTPVENLPRSIVIQTRPSTRKSQLPPPLFP
jgi:alpha-N-arabinofuranosidase